MENSWDRHAILAEINRQGQTLTSLEEKAGLPRNSLSVALGRSFPKAERCIAAFLDVPANILFAYRDEKNLPSNNNSSKSTQGRTSQKNEWA